MSDNNLSQKKQKQYEEYVKAVTPVHSLPLNMCKAFFTGGVICVVGQVILNYADNLGLDKDTAGSWCSLILILFSVILTGCNLYSKIGRFGGAGSLVPITGFANSVASSAIEYKAEGQVFGIGCKIFTIAGPVILYGILSSWILGDLLSFYNDPVTIQHPYPERCFCIRIIQLYKEVFYEQTNDLRYIQHFISESCLYPELCFCCQPERRRRAIGRIL